MKEVRKLVTCKEATELLNNGSVVMAEFRPLEIFVPRGHYQDADPAYIWAEL